MSDHLLILHLKEEWRMMTSYFSSEKLFFAFPFVILCVGFLMGILIPFFEEAFHMKELVIAFHMLLLVYGLFVGGFGFFADEVAERWFRDVNLLIHMHHILPVSFRRIFVWFYLKDMVYYLVLTLLPLFLGAFLSFTIPVTTFVRVMTTSLLSFFIGVSVSFLVSSFYVRSRISFVVFLILGALFVMKFSYLDFPPLSYLFERDITMLFASFAIFIVFSVVSLFVTTPVTRVTGKPVTKTRLFSSLDPLLAKEIIDVKRSGTFRIIATSYLFPLLFLYGIFYFSGRLFHFNIDIPLLFYAVFMGYLSTLVYSWLNNIDPPSCMALLPVTTSQIIKKKIRLFTIFSLSVGVCYLLVLSSFLQDTGTLLLSVFVMGSTTFYVAAVTAWLCGLYPNTRLFDGIVLAKYIGAILPVLIFLSILSLMRAYSFIVCVSLGVFVVSLVVYRQLEPVYKDVFVS
jgi:hypothetical protein